MLFQKILFLKPSRPLIVHAKGYLKKTCLNDFHKSKGGKMVEFAGFEMPVFYKEAHIIASHLHTRNHTSIFDVSHMLQTEIYGKDRVEFIESLVVSDIDSLKENQGTLTLFTNELGGILDDLIVTKTTEGYLYVVSNAGCIEKDSKHMQTHAKAFHEKGKDVEISHISDMALLAIQGPGAVKVLSPLVSANLSKLPFMTSTLSSICGVPDCRITRCGYTGEDGVEISVPSSQAQLIVETLLTSKEDKVALAGLGSRDTLRLEAGLCLYGNDIDEYTTPVEAGLNWTIGKRRREMSNFPGASIIMKQFREKPANKRVGLMSTGPVPRANTPIVNEDGDHVGKITSGCPSPSLKKNIAMAYVPSRYAKSGTKLLCQLKGKNYPIEVTKMPFVPTNYFQGK